MNNIKQWGYSKNQAAEATSLSVRSIDNFIATGALKEMKAGSRVIISAKSLENFIKRENLTFKSANHQRLNLLTKGLDSIDQIELGFLLQR